MNPESGADINTGGENSRERALALCTSLLTNGVQRVDDGVDPGGNEKVRWITLCFSKYLLTRGFAVDLLMLVPESARRPGR